MKFLRALSASLLLVSTAAAGQDSILDAVVRIDVPCRNGGSPCWGTGVVVQRQPVVIATCYHVVAGRAKVGIYSPKYGTWLEAAAARSIAAFPESDVAFLLIDIQPRQSLDDWGEILSWPATASVLSTPIGSLLEFVGGSDYDYPNGFRFDELSFVQQLPLRNLGGPNPLELQWPSDPVIETKAGVYPGDSGAPVLDRNGRLIGLVAGRVTQQVNSKPRYFAVPASPRIPQLGSQAWKNLPVTQPSIFGHHLLPYVTSLVGEPQLPVGTRAGQFNTRVQACLPRLEPTLREFSGRLHELPTTSEISGCEDVYDTLREPMVERARLLFKEQEASFQTRLLEHEADRLAVAEVEFASSQKVFDNVGIKMKIGLPIAKARAAVAARKTALDAISDEAQESLKATDRTLALKLTQLPDAVTNAD